MKTKFILLLIVAFSANAFSQKNDSATSQTDNYVADATIIEYIVIAGTSKDYNYLETKAKQISKQTDIEFENRLIYDKNRGMIVPDTSSDEIYAGSYFPRRYAEERISIEMLWYYKDEQNDDTLKDMIIITGIFASKDAAQKQLEKIKAIVPTAYIKKKNMYIGCMH